MTKICKMRIFLKKGFRVNLYPLTSCKISKKSNEPILSNIQESPFSAKNDRKWRKFAKREFSLKKSLGWTYTPQWSLTSCKILKKSNETILSNIYKKVYFFHLLCPLLLLFALFWETNTFPEKRHNLKRLKWYSIFMHKIIKNGWTVQKI